TNLRPMRHLRLQCLWVREALTWPLSIVDESWETLDPSPDVRAMFLEFNDMFFWGKLSGVEVKWSPRMTLCAGVCSYEGRGGLCSIRLSEPLLKLRPRKDLVETLLHEMIHALLFVTQNNRDRDGHGPEFCKHMNRINKASGTKITIYHSFHDEVDVYRQHWWRCSGPCQSRKPYFGYVKRAMNRAPSSLDPWWEDHKRSCGGTYTKVKEPEGYASKKRKKETKTSGKKPARPGKDIRNVVPFSGKGFVLGGASHAFPSSSTSLSPWLAASPSSISSPKTPPTPSSPFAGLSSPPRSGSSDPTDPICAGGKPPVKRSNANSRVFVSIDGSPVRLPRSQSRAGSQRGDAIKQTSIQDLFNGSALRKSAGRPFLTQSWDDRSSSAKIFDFFERTLSSSSAASREALKTQSASAPAPSSLQPSAAQQSGPASSSSSSAVMVSCPVCQAKVQEAKINEHLDSCLS
uniref:DNA-dependent metalloprotease SPRTN n=1 Tax=Fundulus heteroclitus TaxID=8078 RepID=A0A3Q2PL30_FUNHE